MNGLHITLELKITGVPKFLKWTLYLIIREFYSDYLLQIRGSFRSGKSNF